MGPSATIQHVRHIAAQVFGARLAVPAMVDALETLMPSRTRTMMWVNDAGIMTDFYEKYPVPEAVEPMIMAAPQLAADPLAPSLDKMANSPCEYNGWRRFEAFPGWEKSILKNELFRGYGIGNNMDFPLRSGGRARAVLAFGREPGSRGYARREIEMILGLRAHFLHAMDCADTALVLDETAAPDDPRAMLVQPDGAIGSCGAEARLMLYHLALSEDRHSPFHVTTAPHCLREVMVRLDLSDEGRNRLPPSLVVMTPWGAIKVIAHTRTGAGEYVLTLQRRVPRNLVRIQRSAGLPLSPREREIAVAMCGTAGGDGIARSAGLSISSYREYARRIYARLGVDGRQGVRELLDG